MRRDQIKKFVDKTTSKPYSDATSAMVAWGRDPFLNSLSEEEWDYLMKLIEEKTEYYQNHPDEMPEIIAG